MEKAAVFGKKISFDLGNFGSELKKARFAHVELEKAWGTGESALITKDDKGPIEIQYDGGNQIVYLTPTFK